jgi:enamine deaminase RidA (YjgF/YER057c/UK114 family)
LITRMRTSSRISQIVVHDNTVYLAGQVASNLSTDTAGQTREILGTIDDLLAEAGTTKSHVLAATVYLAHMNSFAAMNTVWEEWVGPGCAPARTTVEARLAAPGYQVEITIVAGRS